MASTGELKNANPTILNLSDLPTRKPTESLNKAQSPLTTLIPSYSRDPFIDDSDSSGASSSGLDSDSDETPDPIDAQEIYDLVATMCDPEHPITLGELAVVSLAHITVHDPPGAVYSSVVLEFTPTITHCHLATVIGLGLVVRLQQSLPSRFRVDVRCREGTHTTDRQLNKQLADKERVLSALENETLMGLVGKMIETCK
ncbi:hypothetical protein EDC01DRAFT_417719 [Geopyxis carbonaria]|nr:hypothetical protein EDC01DRAFT_417719 [Geopyxis carbonaria]